MVSGKGVPGLDVRVLGEVALSGGSAGTRRREGPAGGPGYPRRPGCGHRDAVAPAGRRRWSGSDHDQNPDRLHHCSPGRHTAGRRQPWHAAWCPRRRSTYRLNIDPNLIDYHRFGQHTRTAHSHATAGDHHTAAAEYQLAIDEWAGLRESPRAVVPLDAIAVDAAVAALEPAPRGLSYHGLPPSHRPSDRGLVESAGAWSAAISAVRSAPTNQSASRHTRPSARGMTGSCRHATRRESRPIAGCRGSTSSFRHAARTSRSKYPVVNGALHAPGGQLPISLHSNM